MGKGFGIAAWAKTLAAVFVVALICAGHCTAAEMRAFWVDAWSSPGLLNQTDVDNLLGVPGTSSGGDIRNANCNAVVVQVRKNCDANYPSNMGEPYMGGLTPTDFNSLQAIINAAHDTTGGKKRIEVHAWMVTFRTSGGTVYGNHHSTPTGSLTTLDNYWPTRNDGGSEVSPDYALDPGHPLAEDYTVNVAMDIVKNFDVDGIHFDYVRFTGSNQGYNPTSVARYDARYGLSSSYSPGAADPQWQQWRRDQVTAVVRKVYAKVQASKPWVKVSGSFVAGNPSPTSATRAGFQVTTAYTSDYCDWDAWMEEGIVDAAFPMTYYDYNSGNQGNWTQWINFEKDRHFNRHMYIGPGIYLNYLSDAITELLQTRTASPAGNHANGFCGYSYRCPYILDKSTNPTTYGTWSTFAPQLTSQVTPTWDDIPDMPWKSAPTTGHISGTVTYYSGGKWADGATVSIAGPVNRSMYVDGTGFYAFIDVPPGTYTVTASIPGYPSYVKYVVVEVGVVTGNMYITDFQLGAPVLPPAISNVAADGVSGSSTGIIWKTDQPASSQVQYGTTTSYGSTTALDNTQVMSHAMGLTGLTTNTLYHYRVISGNANGTTTSGDYTFTTDGPPILSGIQATNLTTTSATIIWNTNGLCDSKVNYGLTNSYGSQVSNSMMSPTHSITLTGLTASTTYHYQCVSTNSFGTGTSTDLTFTTLGPPAISGVGVSSITPTTATITWTTDQAADTKVNYGTTSSYGRQMTDASLVTSHSLTLYGLVASTVYHYQCVSTNANGTGTATDRTFTTIAPPADIVLNDTATTRTGTWTTLTGSGYSSDYRYSACRRTSSTGICTWTPSITVAGNYDVYCTYPLTTTPTANATFTVNYNGGSTSASFDQASNTGTGTTPNWNLIASHLPFAAGTGGSISLNNLTGESNGTRRVVADAVKLVYIVPGVPDVIVDDADPEASWTGTWTGGGTNLGSAYNSTYKYANTAVFNTAEYKWTPKIAVTGMYDVYCWYTSGSDRSTAANYEIHGAGGTRTVPVNETSGGGGWVLLTSFLRFDSGTTGYVKLNNNSATGSIVVADAIRWVYRGEPVDTPPVVSIGSRSGSITRTGPISYPINYSDDVGVANITLSSGDVILNKTGTANGTATVSGSGTATRTVTVNGITGDGTISISLAAGTALDTVGNLAPAAGPSTTFTVDNTPPSVSISSPSANQTSSGPVTYTITYAGANVVTLANADITLNKTGNANGTVTVSGSGNGSRTVTISSITGNGTLGISIAAGTAFDGTDNYSLAAGPSTTFAVQNTAPTVSISAPSATSGTSGPVTYTVTYTGATSVTLTNANVTLNKTGTANGTVSVSGTGTTTRTVTISSITGDGTLGISIAAGTASDSVGNTAPAAGPSATFAVDNTAPTIAIGAPSANLTAGGPITYTVTYTGADSVTLANANVTLNKTGTANGTVAVSGSGNSTRTVTVSSITGDGTLGIAIAAGTATDNAGNSAPAAGASATFTVDNSAPTVSIGAPSTDKTSGGPISYTITYAGADSVTLANAAVTLNKTGTADGTVAVSGSGTTGRTVTISSITGTGTLGISIASGTASDTLGNTAPAAGPSTTFVVDNTAPVMGTVTDEAYTILTDQLLGSWSATDAETGIQRYEYAVGTDPIIALNDIVDWTSAGAAGSANITGLSLTIGQTYYISARAVNGVGLTSAPATSTGVAVAYAVDTVRAAKALEDGKPVGLPATVGLPTSYVVSAKFATCFYLEDNDRLSGIRVDCQSNLVANQMAKVFGIMGLTADGERAILSPRIIANAMGTAVAPFGTKVSSIGGQGSGFTPGVSGGIGLNNIGLLVKIAGKVTHNDADCFYVGDGVGATDDSGYAGIRVFTGALTRGYEGSYVVVTGVVSCRKVGSTIYPQILAKTFVEY